MSQWVVLATALLLAAPLAAASLPEIRGTVHEGDRDHPLPGVLVALYDASDFLVDSTYTRDDGGFRLFPPQRNGRFYLIATRGGSSRRAEFHYDPAAGRGKYVAISFSRKEKSPLVRAVLWLLEKLGAVIGLLVGYLFRLVVEERATAKTKRDLFLSDLRAAAKEALAQYPAVAPGARLKEIDAAVHRIRQLLDRRTDIEDVLPKLKFSKPQRERAQASFRDLTRRVAELEDFLAKAKELPPKQQDEKLQKAKEILQELRDRPLG